jgi:hypothetical protein
MEVDLLLLQRSLNLDANPMILGDLKSLLLENKLLAQSSNQLPAYCTKTPQSLNKAANPEALGDLKSFTARH